MLLIRARTFVKLTKLMIPRMFKLLLILTLTSFVLLPSYAQLGKITIDLEKDKPEKFKTKTLKSEKTGEKKFTLPRRFIQNTVSHYNYYFNANNKINEVIERARLSNKDDYSKLLSFYGYTLESTAAQASDLDSVIYKATAGILLHDLRSSWVDNLYLLIGKAYYLKRDFDSASMTFQFINYNLYPKKKKEDDQLIVGSNDNRSNGAMSISSKEDRNILEKALSKPPSRNDALVWQIRTLIDMEEYGDAAGLMNTLQNDPVFPGRLDPNLEEVSAYWFYKQEMYDSTIAHLENTLPVTIDLEDRARREFLLAQLSETTGKLDTASNYYEDAIHHTTDPLMDIYANLNKAKMFKSKDPAELERSIQTLVRMARKDKYDLYRDIIYFATAELAMEKPDTAAGIFYLKKSTFYNESNPSYKNMAFLKLAEISYHMKDYKNAYAYYDSLQIEDTTLGNIEEITKRKDALKKIVAYINVIEREDSLQTIAAMSPGDREAFLKKLSKKLQKERGIKDTAADYTNAAAAFYDTQNAGANIFSPADQKGDWYFYNTSLKSKGYSEFKRIWGKRSNSDNWRRQSGVGNASRPSDILAGDNIGDPMSPANPGNGFNTDSSANNFPGIAGAEVLPEIPFQSDITVAGLGYNVPQTKEMMDISNSKIAGSLFQLGKNYQVLLEDYYAAINAYESSLQRFPDSLYQGELYMNLSFCYQKTGNNQKAEFYKNLLLNKFSKSKFSQKILHPESLQPAKKNPEATKRYKDIYSLFIEGNFAEATKQKKVADSLYGNNYWDPQLLYIESVYYIRQRDDSTAINILSQIISQYPTSPLQYKAQTMIDVLEKRASIEQYLTNLTIERAEEDTQMVVYDSAKISKRVMAAIVNQPVTQKEVTVTKTEQPLLNAEKKLGPAITNGQYTFDQLVPQSVVMVLHKVDPVYINEAKNAFTRYNREKFRTLALEIVKDTLDNETHLLLFREFPNADEAMVFVNRIKRDAASEVSWLPANKYSFYIISDANLEVLKQNKTLPDYLELLNKKYPGNFKN